MKSHAVFEPNYVSSPGDVIAEWLDERNMTQAEFAVRLGMSAKTLNQIVKGRAPLTYTTALKLERVTSIPARFWNAAEANFQEFAMRTEANRELEGEDAFPSMFPVAFLRKIGYIKSLKSDNSGIIRDLLSFFQVADTQSWEGYWKDQVLAFRKSSVYESKIGSVAAWLRLGEIHAEEQDVKHFNQRILYDALPKLRACTLIKDPNVFLPKIQQILNSAGVAFVVLKEIPGTHCSGVTRWVLDKPIVQLSLRHKTDDHLWFTLFHEVAHVLLHPKNLTYLTSEDIDGTRDSKRLEDEANKFSQELMIPSIHALEFPGLTSKSAICAFAKKLEIAPGIVVGRLQKENYIKYSLGNELKIKYTF
jgi:HTH-type transcriptional regulator/antitoxin HigA